MTTLNTPLVHTARTVGASVLDSLTTIGGVAAGTVVGRLAHQHTSDRHGSTGRLAAAVVAGLAAALLADGLIDGVAAPLRRQLTAPPRPAVGNGDVRSQVVQSVSGDAASKASFHWSLGATAHPIRNRELWRGHEDGTATYYLSPGTYLRFQPSHHELGTQHSVGWTEQYTLESGTGTTVITSPAHLLELLDPSPASSEAEPADLLPGTPAYDRLNQLTEVVDLALSELDEDDLHGASVTAEAIQKRAADQGLTDITPDEAVDVINTRLEHRRTSA